MALLPELEHGLGPGRRSRMMLGFWLFGSRGVVHQNLSIGHFPENICGLHRLAQGFFTFVVASGLAETHFFRQLLQERCGPTELLAAMEEPDSQLERLESDRRQLKRKAAEVKTALKKAKRKEETARRAWQLTTFMSHVVLIAYALCDYQSPAAIRYLVVAGRKRGWPEKSESELQELVESMFLECDTEVFTDLADKAHPSDPQAFQVAAQHSEEWKMAAYVRDQNVRLGLAPSTESLLHRWGSRRAAYPEASGPADFGTVVEPKARKRMQRWRGRWGAQIGTVRLREELPLGESRSKAGHKIRVEKGDQNWGRKMRPKKGPPVVVTIGKMYRSWILSPFLGSYSEPKMGSENESICARFGTGFWQAF